jgi:hypothetical protein
MESSSARRELLQDLLNLVARRKRALADRIEKIAHRDALQVHELASAGAEIPEDLRAGLADLPCAAVAGGGAAQETNEAFREALRVLGDRGALAGLRECATPLEALVHEERTMRMTVVGSLVLAIGAGLIFGAIYYKTHREECTARLDAWRRRFDVWE